MSICIYKGSEKLVRKSGVGSAISHQEAILKDAGYDVVQHIDAETEAVHLKTVFPNSVIEALIAKICRKTVIYYGHSTMEDFRNSFKGSNLLAPLFRKWIKLCYSMGDVILMPTEYSLRLLISFGIKKPIIAVSNGIDIQKFVPNAENRKVFRRKYHLSEDKKVILSVGHYIERKGILKFIEMARKMPEVQFLWFGYTNPKLIPLKIQKAIKAAPTNVLFPGYVTPDELKYAYQGSDLFCFMSHEETEGIVVLEALACEIPVLVRDIPVYEDWLNNGVNVYKASDTSEFIRKAEKILNGSLPDLTKQGRETAMERSFPEIADKMKLIYQKYCTKKSPLTWKRETVHENSDR